MIHVKSGLTLLSSCLAAQTRTDPKSSRGAAPPKGVGVAGGGRQELWTSQAQVGVEDPAEGKKDGPQQGDQGSQRAWARLPTSVSTSHEVSPTGQDYHELRT